ncbi:MAG: hypothetical protein ACLGIA_07110 [Actinomycetes bacterium]
MCDTTASAGSEAQEAGVCGTEAVIVTGAHRSGTTLLGDILSRDQHTWTVWEPFNRHWGLAGVEGAYPFLRASDADRPPVSSLARYLRTGRARWSANRGSTGPDFPQLRAIGKTLRRHVLWRREGHKVPVVKDPFALLALGALQGVLGSRPAIVSVRHPCAWVTSLRRMGWPAGHELNDLLEQEELYELHLKDLLPRRNWTKADDLEAGARAWACLYHMVREQSRAGAQVLVVPIEAYGREPVATMSRMFSEVGLRRPADLASIAEHYSGSSVVTPDAGTKHLLQRNSRALNEAWKSKLTSQEARRVRSITEPVFEAFYSDWESAEASLSDSLTL